MKTTKEVFRNKYVLIIMVLIVGVFLGYLIAPSAHQQIDSSKNQPAHQHIDSSVHQKVWTCSMHPQIRQPEPGNCPICGMDLIPVEKEKTPENPDAIQMTEYAMKLANVQTMTVGTEAVTNEIRLNGKIAVDERLAYSQSTHMPGRIEKLFVNFTGEKVSRGQALARVYSPEMVTAQEELLQAYSIRESNPRLFEAAKQKLRNWKISEAQINRILERGMPSEQFTITADMSGVVTEKKVELGDYVERGMPIYEITNLSRVWVLFDIYESQMSAIEEGSTVEFSVASFPGKIFEGKVDFIDPLIDPQTRVSTARVVVENRPAGQSHENKLLKPGMLVSGVLKNSLNSTKKTDSGKITIPNSAVLWTGKRSVVYVKQNPGIFEMREVVLGPSLGNNYVVKQGLKTGEEIVINGTFTVDAAAQLAGKPSMMSLDTENHSEEPTRLLPTEISEETKTELKEMVKKYFLLKDALVNDDFSNAKNNVLELAQLIKTELNATAATSNNPFQEQLKNEIEAMAAAKNIDDLRSRFDELSTATIEIVKAFPPDEKIYIQHCPMANSNAGADWLSLSSEVRNPYFGQSMLTCGSVLSYL